MRTYAEKIIAFINYESVLYLFNEGHYCVSLPIFHYFQSGLRSEQNVVNKNVYDLRVDTEQSWMSHLVHLGNHGRSGHFGGPLTTQRILKCSFLHYEPKFFQVIKVVRRDIKI